jgi:hypothetical protein
MTKEEILKRFRQLPLEERMAAAEEISRTVKDRLKVEGKILGVVQKAGEEEPTEDRDMQKPTIEEKLAAFHRLEGMLKTGGSPPTDDELKEEYINHLAEKYS